MPTTANLFHLMLKEDLRADDEFAHLRALDWTRRALRWSKELTSESRSL